jgi:hypothetical protein
VIKAPAAALLAVRKKKKKKCFWRQNEIYGYWDTACGQSWDFEVGGPKKNKVKFCPFCGHRLQT